MLVSTPGGCGIRASAVLIIKDGNPAEAVPSGGRIDGETPEVSVLSSLAESQETTDCGAVGEEGSIGASTVAAQERVLLRLQCSPALREEHESRRATRRSAKACFTLELATGKTGHGGPTIVPGRPR